MIFELMKCRLQGNSQKHSHAMVQGFAKQDAFRHEEVQWTSIAFRQDA